MLCADIAKFNFIPDRKLQEKGFTVDVKKQLYRFPSILLFDLAIVFETVGESSWATLENLSDRGNISYSVYQDIQFLLACACFIRLSAYLYHNSHDDRISVAEMIEELEATPSPHRRWFVPMDLFSHLCDRMIPLKAKLNTLDSSYIEEHIANMSSLDDVDPFTKVQTFYCCGHFVNALNGLKHMFGDKISTDPINVIDEIKASEMKPLFALKTVADVLIKCSYHRSALQFSLAIEQLDPGSRDSMIRLAICYRNLSLYDKAIKLLSSMHVNSGDTACLMGQVFLDLGKYVDAEKHLVSALELYHEGEFHKPSVDFYGDEEPLIKKSRHTAFNFSALHAVERLERIKDSNLNVANVIKYFGWLYYRQYDTELAEKYFTKYGELQSAIYGKGANVADRAYLLKNLGDISYQLKEPKAALQHYSKSLEAYKTIYGDGMDHIEVANVITNLGNIYGALGQCDKEIEYYHKAIHMYQSVYGEDSNHADIARVLINMGGGYMTMNRHQTAAQTLCNALEMYRAIYGTEANHTNIALVLKALGVTQRKIRQHESAETSNNCAMAMYKAIYGNECNHINLANVLNEMGINYSIMGYQDRANVCFNESQTMYSAIYGKSNHARSIYANSMNDLGIHCNESGQYSRATTSYHKALSEYEQIYGEEAVNMSIARIYTNLAGNYMCMGEYRNALDMGQKALDMNKTMFGHEVCNIGVARLLCNLGGIYCGLRQFTEAEECLTQSLNMYKQLYGTATDHVGIARVLDKFYRMYDAAGDVVRARERAQQALGMYLVADPHHPAVYGLRHFLGSSSNDSGQPST